jgi:integrase
MPWVERRVISSGVVRYKAIYRDPAGRKRSAGMFTSKTAASKAAHAADGAIDHGSWIEPKNGRITFTRYVEDAWWPSRHLEVSTKAAYRSNLDHHLVPYFGELPLEAILPTTVQAWVTDALAGGLSPRSVRKYHTLLHGIFARAVRDRVINANPAAYTELPKVIAKRMRALTPAEFDTLMTNIPVEHRLMVLFAAETGLRWGELVALRPHHLDLTSRALTVEDVYVEVSKKNSPTGQRMILRHYPKDNEPRSMRITSELTALLRARIDSESMAPDQLLFANHAGQPISRSTFRARVWLPAVATTKLDFHLRWHDLRHTHASWLLAGGADLKTVMDRLGHTQISTTQRYLHTLPNTDDAALTALARVRAASPSPPACPKPPPLTR